MKEMTKIQKAIIAIANVKNQFGYTKPTKEQAKIIKKIDELDRLLLNYAWENGNYQWYFNKLKKVK